MWLRRTLQLVLGGYLVYALFLAFTIHCLPLTINDVVPLPLEVPVISPHRLPLNIGTVLLMVLILVFWLEQARFNRLISLSRTSHASQRATPPAYVTPAAVIVLLITAAASPSYIILQSRDRTAGAVSINEIENEFKAKLVGLSQPLTQPKTLVSPDRPWDSLPYTKLPVMRLEIPRFSHFELNKALPRPREGFNLETSLSVFAKGTEYWPYVPAFFSYDDVRYPVDIRFRGWNFDHYLGFKKSWRIKFRKNDLFFGRRQINVINQRDHTAINDILWSEALRESGIMTPYQFLLHLRIDGEFKGIQTFLEQPDQYFAERHNRNVSDLFGEQEPIVRIKEFTNPDSWQQYARAGLSNDFTPLLELYQTALDKDDPDYLNRMSNLLDVDHYLKYLAHATITCSENPSTHNIRWIRDPAVGRFQILPWYQASSFFIIKGHYDLWKRKGWRIHPPATAINDFADGLLRRPRLREVYFRHMWRMLTSTHHHEYLKHKLDELYHYVRSDAHADTHMHYRYDMIRYVSNAEWEETIARLREMLDSRLRYLEQQIAGGPIKTRWVPSRERNPANLGRIVLVSTNFATVDIDQITLKFPPAFSGTSVTLSNSLHSCSATVDPADGLATFRIKSSITSRADRTTVPLGPGIIIADLGPVKNPEMEFLGGISRPSPHYQPQPTTNSLLLSSPVDVSGDRIQLVSVKARNRITGNEIPLSGSDGEKDVSRPVFSKTAASALQSLPFPNPRRPNETIAFVEPDGVSLGDSQITGKPLRFDGGTHEFTTNLVTAPEQLVTIGAGTTMRFAPGTSMIVRGGLLVEGTRSNPVRFTTLTPDTHWGVLFLNSNQRFTNRISHCIFERSANVMINGMAVTASLAAYSAPVEIHNCVFREMAADDAFNSKYVSPTITACTFSNNLDAIDIDMGGGRVTDCRFINNRDDCIDLSSSWALIDRNRIHSYGDKGISVGEKSRPTIFNNLISHATMGIAVKDLSTALILNNTLVSNRTAVAAYRKKESFGPGTASLINNVIHFNHRPVETDVGSAVTARFNSADAWLNGDGNVSLTPALEPDTLKLRPDKKISAAGSGRPPSYYGLRGNEPLKRIGHF